MTYHVKNVFRTVQGEGLWTGTPAIFVRLVGCNMWTGKEDDRERDAERTGADCPLWCDTDFTPDGATKYSADGLAEHVYELTNGGVAGQIRHVVLTGGEPFLQADQDLVDALQDLDLRVAAETNGTVSIEDAFGGDHIHSGPDFITCSPKVPEEQLELELFHEFKLVVPDYRPEQYERFLSRGVSPLPGIYPQRRDTLHVPLLWLTPEAGPRYETAKQLAVDLVQERPRWRINLQTHKYLDVA